jgi:hypothetical protein
MFLLVVFNNSPNLLPYNFLAKLFCSLSKSIPFFEARALVAYQFGLKNKGPYSKIQRCSLS